MNLTESYDASTCDGCGQTIVWAITEPSTNAMPVDPDPADDGNVEVIGPANIAAHARRPLVRVRKKVRQTESLFDTDTPPAVLYHSHFTTCENADHFRRK